MALGPFTTYLPPGAWGPTTVSWVYGESVPGWVEPILKDLCMANLAFKKSRKIYGWTREYFRVKNKKARKYFSKNGMNCDRAIRLLKVNVSDGIVEIAWQATGGHEIKIPKEVLTPHMFQICLVHSS